MTSLQHYHQKLDNIAVSLFTNRETVGNAIHAKAAINIML